MDSNYLTNWADDFTGRILYNNVVWGQPWKGVKINAESL